MGEDDKNDNVGENQYFKKALNYSFLLLKYRARSKGELISRLKRKGVVGSSLDRVIAYLEKYNYINDREFVENFSVISLEKGWGPKKIAAALRKLEISEVLIEKALADKSIYKDKIRELIEKQFHRYNNKKIPYQRVLRYMVNRGFEYGEVVDQIKNNADEVTKQYRYKL